MRIQSVTLSGRLVVLEPLHERRAGELLSAAAHDEIWSYLDEPTPNTPEQIQELIADAIRQQEQGRRVAFSIINRATGAAVGSTSYIDIRPGDRGVEIGWAWISPDSWGSGINTEATYLLLRHAFDDQGAIRVAMKADVRNARSRRAIESLGGVLEGIWRNHRILSTGRYRDSAYYSVIDSEWPTVKAGIEARLERRHNT